MEFHDDDFDHAEWDRGEEIAMYEDGSILLFVAELVFALVVISFLAAFMWGIFALV